MLNNNKESTERSKLFSFLKDVGISLSPQQVIRGEDPPDFIVNNANNHYSFELTELFMDKQGKYPCSEIEAAENKILRQTAIGLEQEKLPCMEVKVHFGKTPYPNNGYDIDHVATALVKLIKVKVKNKVRDFRPIIIRNPEIEGVSLVHIRSAFCKGVQWLYSHRTSTMSIHWVKQDPLKEIMNAIRKKENKLKQYKKNYNRSYLLLIFNRIKWTQAFKAESLRGHIKRTSFDGIFLHDYGLKNSIELTAKRISLQEFK